MSSKVRKLKSEYGAISLLKNNPRQISGAAYSTLSESVEAKPYMLNVRGIVVWRVPENVSEDGPFAGQAGELVVLGGNQRCKVLMEQGYESIPSKWVSLAKGDDGEWWSEEDAQQFVLMDNNPDGIAGTYDYDKMIREYDKRLMAAAGIDVSNFAIDQQQEIAEESSVEDDVEKGEHGEKDPELEEFIAKRERTREDLPELMETGFYLCLVFETHGQKMEFLEKAGIEEAVEYEMFVDGVEFAREKCGVEIERSGLHFPDMRIDGKLAELAMENDQEPEEMTLEDARKGYEKQSAECGAALDWISRHVGEDAPLSIRERLGAYKEWAEDEKSMADGMLAAIREKEAEETEKRKSESQVSAAFARAEAERREAGMKESVEEETEGEETEDDEQ